MKRITPRDARRRAKLTQQELADRTGLRQGLISAIESGTNANPTLRTIEKLEEALLRPGEKFVFGEQDCEVAK